MWTCKPAILFNDNVNIYFFSDDMDNEIETPKLNQTHEYRHGHLVCQICLKSCEKRFLKRRKKTVFQKFCNYAEKWEKKTDTFNTVKSHVS